MGLFSKKYDKDKDKLKLVFNIELLEYQFYYQDKLINYKDLNKNTKKYLDNENKFLKANPNIIENEKYKIEAMKSNGRRNFLISIGYDIYSFEYLGPNNGTMSKELEQYLNELVSRNNVLIGINRVGQQPDEYIIDNLLNGILMTGYSGSGVLYKPKLCENVSYYADNRIIIKELMYANTYKNSKGSILIKIPDSDLQNDDIIIQDKNGNYRLNPKYILGYIPVSKDHHIERIITPYDIQKQRRIENNHYSNEFNNLNMHR